METIISHLPNRVNYMHGRYTIEIGYPWFTYGAIIAMEMQLKPEHNILELGSGGSTIFFSRRCKHVKSYETNIMFKDKVNSALPSPSNVVIICGDGETLIKSLKEEPEEYYDWLLVDTAHKRKKIKNMFRLRYSMMIEGIPKLKKGGFMVVDNYAAVGMNIFDYTNWDVYTFDDFMSNYVGRGTRICQKK